MVYMALGGTKMLMDEVRRELLMAAIDGRTVTYGHLMEKFGLSRGSSAGESVVAMLGKIDRNEAERNAPGFAAIVVRKDTGFPGGGFFCWDDIPASLRRPNSEGQNPKLSDAEKRYVRDLQEAIWNYYKKQARIQSP